MSGHSKWSTIKRKKEATDKAKGKLFSKFAKAISVAVKAGGGSDPEKNYKLRLVVDQARGANMPGEVIERAIGQAAQKEANLEEVSYECVGPSGVSIILEVATDNRRRTAQELKGILERGGGRLAGPGAVAFNFEHKGLILVAKAQNYQEQVLGLIDLGVEEIVEAEDAIEAYTTPQVLSQVSQKIKEQGWQLSGVELTQKPKNTIQVKADEARKVLRLLSTLEDHEDVQKVFSNADIPDALLNE